MNNEAFQKLVRAGVKTSKEIAREAVLEEARQKGKKRGGGRRSNNHEHDYSSDDDDESNKKNKKKQRRKAKEQEVDPEEEERLAELSKKYRDRAQERRDGGGGHVAAAVDATAKSAAETIFDDVVDALETGNRQKLAQLRTATTAAHPDDKAADDSDHHPPSTPQEALDWIINNSNRGGRRPPTTELGTEMLRFLKQQYAPDVPTNGNENDGTVGVSAAGQRLQQSVLTFQCYNDCQQDCLGAQQQQQYGWDAPTERTYASNFDSSSSRIQKGTDCSCALLTTMERTLQRVQQQQQQQQQTKRLASKKKRKSEKKSEKNQPEGGATATHPEANDEDEAAAEEKNNSESASDDDDDDDDIFGGVGGYDGATAIQKGGDPEADDDSAGQNLHKTKESIFGGETTKLAAPQTKVTFASSASSAQAATRLVGFASNDANDDDGIGMDFDGRDYEEDDDRKKKKKKKKRKKGGDDDSDDD